MMIYSLQWLLVTRQRGCFSRYSGYFTYHSGYCSRYSGYQPCLSPCLVRARTDRGSIKDLSLIYRGSNNWIWPVDNEDKMNR